jgi:hypothetical protein
MKPLGICVLALTLAPTLAMAQTAVGTGVGIANSESQSGALAVANNRGNGNSSINVTNPANTTATVNSNVSGTTTSNVNQNVSGATTSRVVSSGTTTVKTAPSMVAPGLAAAGLETCLGSASGTVSAIGFGIGGGSTYADEGCQARLDSRTLFAYGLKEAAVARLCQRSQVWNSMPQICERYWPAGMPVPAGVLVVQRANVVMSAEDAGTGVTRVVDGRDGVEKDCLSYSYAKQKCFHWLGEASRRQHVANVQSSQRIPMKPKVQKPKVEPKVEPTKLEPPIEAPKTEENKT